MSYLENRKKIEIKDSYLGGIEGNLKEVIDELTEQHNSFKEQVESVSGYEVFVLVEQRYPYYSDNEVPYLVAYRWETEGEYNLRINEELKQKEKQKAKELKLLAELKKKYEG